MREGQETARAVLRRRASQELGHVEIRGFYSSKYATGWEMPITNMRVRIRLS